MRRALSLLSLFFALPAGAAELRIAGPELASILQTAFSGTVIRLHRDGPPPAPGKPPVPGSILRLGPRIGGQRFPFSIPAKEVSLGLAGRARFTVNDVNSNPDFLLSTAKGPVKFGQTIRVAAVPAGFVITLRFEDQGTELIGQPVGRLASMRSGLVPNVQVNSIYLQIVLFPTNTNGTLAFRPVRVIFDGDIQATGLADIRILGTRVDLVDEITNYKAELKTSIEREVAKLIDQNLGIIARNVSVEARRRGAALGVRVDSVRFEGTTLVVSGTPVL